MAEAALTLVTLKSYKHGKHGRNMWLTAAERAGLIVFVRVPCLSGSSESPSTESPVEQSLQAKFIAKFAENLGKISSGLSGGSSSNNSPGSGGADGSSSSSTEGSANVPSEFLNK